MDKENPLFRFVRDFLPQVEGGTKENRYQAIFSTGRSGMSFGAMQNDPLNNPAADQVWNRILDEAVDRREFDKAYRDRLYKFSRTNAEERARQKAAGAWMTEDDETRLNGLLAHPENQELINLLDDTQADIIARDMQALMENMRGRPGGAGVLDPDNPDMATLGRLAAWHNRTGGLTQTQEYLLSAPGALTADTVKNRISSQKQFRPIGDGGRGENYSTWDQRVFDAAQRARSPGH